MIVCLYKSLYVFQSGKLQNISEKLQIINRKFQNNAINGIKQISNNSECDFRKKSFIINIIQK